MFLEFFVECLFVLMMFQMRLVFLPIKILFLPLMFDGEGKVNGE